MKIKDTIEIKEKQINGICNYCVMDNSCGLQDWMKDSPLPCIYYKLEFDCPQFLIHEDYTGDDEVSRTVQKLLGYRLR